MNLATALEEELDDEAEEELDDEVEEELDDEDKLVDELDGELEAESEDAATELEVAELVAVLVLDAGIEEFDWTTPPHPLRRRAAAKTKTTLLFFIFLSFLFITIY